MSKTAMMGMAKVSEWGLKLSHLIVTRGSGVHVLFVLQPSKVAARPLADWKDRVDRGEQAYQSLPCHWT